jgi:hypothetical protein
VSEFLHQDVITIEDDSQDSHGGGSDTIQRNLRKVEVGITGGDQETVQDCCEDDESQTWN